MPQKLNNPKDLKACYRLMNCEDVTHEAIMNAHRVTTLAEIEAWSGPVLILHDATELGFTKHLCAAETMRQIGSGNHRG